MFNTNIRLFVFSIVRCIGLGKQKRQDLSSRLALRSSVGHLCRPTKVKTLRSVNDARLLEKVSDEPKQTNKKHLCVEDNNASCMRAHYLPGSIRRGETG